MSFVTGEQVFCFLRCRCLRPSFRFKLSIPLHSFPFSVGFAFPSLIDHVLQWGQSIWLWLNPGFHFELGFPFFRAPAVIGRRHARKLPDQPAEITRIRQAAAGSDRFHRKVRVTQKRKRMPHTHLLEIVARTPAHSRFEKTVERGPVNSKFRGYFSCAQTFHGQCFLRYFQETTDRIRSGSHVRKTSGQRQNLRGH